MFVHKTFGTEKGTKQNCLGVKHGGLVTGFNRNLIRKQFRELAKPKFNSNFLEKL